MNKQTQIRRVLIANRGEIAIRIAQAAAGLGLETVSIYAPADAMTLHTRVADISVPPELYTRIGLEVEHLFARDTIVAVDVVGDSFYI